MTDIVRQLFLIRHATPIVAAGTCYGRTDLEVESEAESRLLSDIENQIPTRIKLLSSPLRRCHSTAQQLAKRGYPEPLVDERLAEMHFGDWEGQQWKHIDRSQIDAWAQDIVNFTPPGGESVRSVANRALACLAAQEFDSDLAILTHAGVIQCLCKLLLKEPLGNFSQRKIEYGSLTRLTRTQRQDGSVVFTLHEG